MIGIRFDREALAAMEGHARVLSEVASDTTVEPFAQTVAEDISNLVAEVRRLRAVHPQPMRRTPICRRPHSDGAA